MLMFNSREDVTTKLTFFVCVLIFYTYIVNIIYTLKLNICVNNG